MSKPLTNLHSKVSSKEPVQSVAACEVPSEHAPVVAYDDSLLERARIQWQFGDWPKLARLNRSVLQGHPQRAKLALFAAAGRLQTGQIAEAQEFIGLAEGWGAGKALVCQILAAGIHNSLGRAAALAGNFSKAFKHFESSIANGMPGTDKALVTGARIDQQYSQLGISSGRLGDEPHVVRSGQGGPRANHGFTVRQLTEIDFGDAWAGNSINTVIFRHHGILSCEGKQFTAFYVDEHTLRLVQRDLKTNHIRTHDLGGEYNLLDAHNSISMGVDRANHIHICYDHHATQLRYRRSVRPGDITEWSEELPMTGNAETKVTYPTFLHPRNGFPLALLYRDGIHNKGTARLKSYDEASGSWADSPVPVLSGSDSKPWTSNAYWNHPAIDHDGNLHISFVWRTHMLGEEKRVNNINIGYASSTDNGVTWVTSKGRGYQLPITQTNAETVHPVSPGSNLMNQCSMAVDSFNRPHIVYYADDSNGIPQYQYLRYDGNLWHHQIISKRARPFALTGSGTLQIPISRPEIVLDRNDNAYIITRGDHSRGRMVATLLRSPAYVWAPDDVQTVWDEDLGFSEPIVDRVRWAQENVLSLLVQYNEQPNHDLGHRSLFRPIKLIDIRFTA
ncbi:BNR repeat-containing protein [Paraburkholderia sp. J11-2]|uniref:BNR repeat-containing protein n=1 Tax=Paraburkholderia sp. J11-2 TaxID=2805431 RepID=UPI002AB71C21|nr:BNR repeat-containing protein [Paraburkholderia sp. J11-2]